MTRRIYMDNAATSFPKPPGVYEAMVRYATTLGASPGGLLAGLATLSALHQRLFRLYSYASMRADEDTRDASAQAMKLELQQLSTELAAKSSWVDPEILRMERATVERLVAAEAGLAAYRHGLDDLLHRQAHTGTEGEEKILADAGLMSEGPSAIHELLVDADLPRPEVVLSTGETTEYCTGRPVANSWSSQQYLPQPQPTGLPYSERCRDHRMQSWMAFMERAGFTGTPDPEELTGGPLEFGGRVIPVPLGRDTTGAVVEAPTYELAVGPDHAVAAFDLSALLPDEVLWALQTVRAQSARFPTRVEGDVVGAGYFNDVRSGFVDTHPDHQAVHTLLGTVDLGLPGSQYAPVGHAHPTRAFGASVAGYCAMMCHPAAPTAFRGSMGTFQYAYGWLADGFWEPDDVDQRTGFSRYQSFSKWF